MTRKIKNIIIFSLCTLFAGTLAGCDFLDVNPREQNEVKEQYSSEDGFLTSLNGVYLQLAAENLYGKNASMYMPELLANHWLPSESQTDDRYIFTNYSFDNYSGDVLISSVWTAYFKAVMQINDFLENIEKTKVHFSGDLKEILKAEALGLRGLIHLEVLRMWGPVPSTAVSSTKATPYVTEVTLDPNRLASVTWKKVIDGILSDLDEAENLLKDIDPVLKHSPRRLNREPGAERVDQKEWLDYRVNHFNYWTAVGAKARLYNWIATSADYSSTAPELALQYALEVIEGLNEETGGLQFPLTNSQSLNSSGLAFFGECLFAVHNPKLGTIIQPLFKDIPPELTQTQTALNTAYETSSYGANDIRTRSTWETGNNVGIGVELFRKFGGNSTFEAGQSESSKDIVPVLRVSEMYLIMVEQGTLAQANTYFNIFRNARSMDSNLDDTIIDDAARKERLEKEYRKEFFGEGQMFFFYKRFGYTTFNWPAGFTLPDGLASYRIPLPKSQQIFE